MNIVIRYFSGTENTKYIAEQFSNKLLTNGDSVDIASMEEKDIPEKMDLLIIGGPIYAGNIPENLIKYILRKTPKTDKFTNAFVYTTSAGLLNANGVYSMASKLEKKGYKIIGMESFAMPRNFYFGRYEPMKEDYIKEMIENAKLKIDINAEKIIKNNFDKIEVKHKGILKLDLLEELFSVISRLMGKSFKVNENCIKCMKCVKNCPTKNISEKKGVFKYGMSCMMCTRCIHNCPAHAITFGKKLYDQYSLKRYLK